MILHFKMRESNIKKSIVLGAETCERAVRLHDELFGAYATGKRHRE